MKPLLTKPAEKLLLPKPTSKTLKRAKTLFLLSLFVTWLVIPELLWHKLGFIFHHLAVLLHLIYEAISFVLEEGLIHGLGMEKYYAQMLVFYCFLSLALWLCYRVWVRLPHLLQAAKSRLLLLSLDIKYRAIETWLALTVWQKVKFVLLNLIGLTGGFIILFA